MDLIADLHAHTVASGHAYSTIQELATAAADKEIEILAMTDHGPKMPGGAHPYHFGNIKVLPDEIKGVKILKGIEANIVDQRGSLDLGKQDLARLDIVLAGFHVHTGYESGSQEENTNTLLKVINNPLVDIIVHPGNPNYKVDIKRIVQAAKETDTLLEINNSSYHSRPGSKKRCIKLARRAKKAGLPVVLGTDTHYADQIGDFSQALEIINSAGLTTGDVLNTSRQRVEDFLICKNKQKEKYK